MARVDGLNLPVLSTDMHILGCCHVKLDWTISHVELFIKKSALNKASHAPANRFAWHNTCEYTYP